MITQLRNRNLYLVVLTDVLLFTTSLLLAYGVRFTFLIPPVEWQRVVWILPWLLVAKTSVFALTGVYRGMWRYTSIPDAWRIGKASALSTLIILTGLTFTDRFKGYSRSALLADAIFTLFFCVGFRVGIRLLCTYRDRLLHMIKGEDYEDDVMRPVRLLIVGAGDAAAAIIREIQGNQRSSYDVVACLDDDPKKNGRLMFGVPVRGPVERLPHFAKRYQADELLIAMPSVNGEQMRHVICNCKTTGLPFKTLPSLSSLVDGRVTVSDVREVSYEDLLGRPPVRLDWSGIGRYLTGKTVAVTGAGGSIGSELCRQIVRFKPASLVLIEANEFNLYRIEQELRDEVKFAAIHPAMGRVQDRPLMSRIFDKYRPHVVFHAAACKHVPMVELNPWEGVFNNVIGSQVAMEVAEEFGVERFVLVSSDKAVRPTNVMGSCKRMAEVFLQSRLPDRTRFMAVRFGNVVGSSGSVIPRFQQQIKSGGPITLTHPEMTRYFMTIPEACQLILQAGAMGDGGEVFILEMGTPVRIADMARDLIRLSGKVPEVDIQIVCTGLRPGEKLHEELITHGEGITSTAHEKIMVIRRHPIDEDAAVYAHRVREDIATLARTAASYDSDQIRTKLHSLIPEYTPSAAVGVL